MVSDPYFLKYKKPLSIILISFVFILGFLAGVLYRQNKTKTPDNTQALIKQVAEIRDLKDQLYYSNNDQGKLIKKETVDINTDQIPFTSPLFKDKMMRVLTYQFKGKTLVEKVISPDQSSLLTIWEFPNNTVLTIGESQKLAILDTDYFSLSPIYLEDLKKNWTQPYTTSGGIKMFYNYLPTTHPVQEGATLGNVTLQDYQDHFPNYRYAHAAFIEIKVLLYPNLNEARARLYEIANSLTYTKHQDQ